MTSDLPCSEVTVCEWPRSVMLHTPLPTVRTVRPTQARDRIVQLLLLAGKPLTVPQVSRALLKQTNHTRNLLRKMALEGVITASDAPRTQRLGRLPQQYRVVESAAMRARGGR